MTALVLVGVGKIARNQHIPALRETSLFRLAATVSHHGQVDGVPAFASLTDAVKAGLGLEAASLCTPPHGRGALVQEAFGLGLDVMVEKPPALSLAEAEAMIAAAKARGRSLMFSWHARAAGGVSLAQAFLATTQARAVRVAWREDARVWHPGQDWLWQPGLGAFDPGINALSILTALFGPDVALSRADLAIPDNRAAPVRADLALLGPGGMPIAIEIDIDHRGPPVWDIAIETAAGTALLSEGGARFTAPGHPLQTPPGRAYGRVYQAFAALRARGGSDADLSPLRLVEQALAEGAITSAPAFTWAG